MQESIGKLAKAQQVVKRADELRNLRCAGGILKVGPVSGNQRFTAVRQNEHELQARRHAHVTKDLQRVSFKWMMGTRDGSAFGKVLMMGSVSCGPSTECRKGIWSDLSSTASPIREYCA